MSGVALREGRILPIARICLGTEGITCIPPRPPAKLAGVWLYLVILATVYVVASLVLGILTLTTIQSTNRTMQSNGNMTAAQRAKGATPTGAVVVVFPS